MSTKAEKKAGERPQIGVKMVRRTFTEAELSGLGLQLAKARAEQSNIAEG